jgi:glycosyltransferase 2 family protein
MKKLFSQTWFTILYILILSGLALGLALYDSFEVVIQTISQVNKLSLLLMAFWGLLPYLAHGLILKLMASHMMPKYRFIDGFINSLVGGFMSGVTPSSTGGQFAQSYTFKKQGLKASHGAGIIWLDFFLYSITLVVIALLLFFTNFTKFAHSSITLVFGLGLLINVIIIVLLGLMVFKPELYRKLMHFIIHITERWKWVKQKEKMIHAWDQILEHFYEAQTVVTENRGMLWQLFGLNALRILFYFSTPLMIGLILNLEIHWSMVIELIALASFVTIANTFVPLPGAAGATESLFVLTYSTVLGKASAASIMILWRFFSFYLILIIGGILFFKVRHQKAKEIQDEEINYY